MAIGSSASSARRFGATTETRIGGGYGIATFPTMTDGASAMFHLLWSPSYSGMAIWDAMHKWGDGATLEKDGQVIQGRLRTDGYVRSIEQRSRFRRTDIITKAMMEDPARAIEFAKAMAWHEAGREYPMTDAQWVEAHEQFMTVIGGGSVPIDRTSPLPVTAPLEMAKTHLGERRIPGTGTNPFIEGLFIEVGSPLRGDDHSYCAVGAGAMLKRTGFAYISGEPGQLARNYLKYGHALDEPEEGCLVIFWRVKPNSWQGHVAFVESWTATTLTIVGFNQSGAVTRMTVPRTGARSQVLGYRRPVLAVRPATEIVREDSVGQKVVGLFGTITALWYAAKDWLWYVIDSVGAMIGFAPDIAAGVTSNIATGQQITQAAGLPWPAKLGLIIVLITLAFGLYRTWKRLRPNDGSLTRPPYETDIEPDADAVDMFDAEAVTLAEVEYEPDERGAEAGPGAQKPAARRRAAGKPRPRTKAVTPKKPAAKRRRAA